MMDVGKLDTYEDYSNDDLNLPEHFPDPSGSWYLVVYPIGVKSTVKLKGGGTLLLPESAVDSIDQLMTVGMVVRKGKMAYRWNQYKDPVTGEYHDWCDVGDWVCFGRDSNVRAITFSGKKFWIIPDEGILCRLEHPKMIDPRYDFDEQEITALKRKVLEVNERN